MSQRFGTIAVVGAPNAGKSTLVNALVGQKVAIVSPKAQTTRTRLMGIAMLGASQILLTDTPGIFEPKRRLDRAMVAAAWGSAQDVDLIALIVDASTGLKRGVTDLLDRLKDRPEPKLLVLNKVDLVKKEALLTPEGRATDVRREQAKVPGLTHIGTTNEGELLFASGNGALYRALPAGR